jgi:O-antigen ligase
LFGHGLGTSLEANANFGRSAKPAHNLYAEVMQALGFVGLLLFMMYTFSIVRALNKENIQFGSLGYQDTPFVQSAWRAVKFFFGLNLLLSLASYELSGYEWYLVPGLVVVIGEIRSHYNRVENKYENGKIS